MRAVIGAILNLDGGPADPLELERLAARARLPAGGPPRLVTGLEAGLLAVPATAATWPPEAGAPPWRTAGGEPLAIGAAGGDPGQPPRYDVVLDGSLDNRAELARELGAPAADADPVGGPRLLAAAYERWGEDCPSHLRGELAFILWDRRERRLFASRDGFGQRELFYARAGSQLRLASQLQMLLARPSPSDLDFEFAADFLAGIGGCGAATPFRQVSRLEAGHRLSAGAGRLATSPWWLPAERPWPPERSAGEAVEEFRALLEEAVACSLGTGGRVWAELSGGLDSSSICCLAMQILQGEPERARDFATLTYAWKHSPQCDERQWSDRVVAQYGLVNHQVFCDDLFFDGIAEECRYRSEPHFGLFAHPLQRAAGELLRAAGVEVLLSGGRAESVVLGDQMPPILLADTLRSLRLGKLWDQLGRWHRGTHLPLANLLVAFALRPLLDRRRYSRSILDRGEVHPWVDQRFARRMQVAQRGRRTRLARRFRSLAQQHQVEMLRRSEQKIVRGSLEWSCEIRHPFLYRPLVELALAIPWEQKLAPEGGKVLLRRAMAGRLPEAVRTRRGGGGPGADMYKAFARRWHAIEPVVSSSLLVSLGLLDGVEFRRAAELARFGAVEKFVGFLSCLAFEYWLRAVVGGEEAGREHEPAAARRAGGGGAQWAARSPA